MCEYFGVADVPTCDVASLRVSFSFSSSHLPLLFDEQTLKPSSKRKHHGKHG